MTAKEVKQLSKAYKKRFKHLQKSVFDDKTIGLTLFVEYLKYLRDSIILGEYKNEVEDSKIKMASITAAIAEFDMYILVQNEKQRTFHWNAFCELLKQNMEEWLKIDDSV